MKPLLVALGVIARYHFPKSNLSANAIRRLVRIDFHIQRSRRDDFILRVPQFTSRIVPEVRQVAVELFGVLVQNVVRLHGQVLLGLCNQQGHSPLRRGERPGTLDFEQVQSPDEVDVAREDGRDSVEVVEDGGDER